MFVCLSLCLASSTGAESFQNLKLGTGSIATPATSISLASYKPLNPAPQDPPLLIFHVDHEDLMRLGSRDSKDKPEIC